jgi:hypothetical protein
MRPFVVEAETSRPRVSEWLRRSVRTWLRPDRVGRVGLGAGVVEVVTVEAGADHAVELARLGELALRGETGEVLLEALVVEGRAGSAWWCCSKERPSSR